MKRILLIGGVLLLFGCSSKEVAVNHAVTLKHSSIEEKQYTIQKDRFSFEPFRKTPTVWGENVPGVKTHFQTVKKEMALTFDACGGSFGNDVDLALITYLKKENIPATLFVNERWIDANEDVFLELAENPLFQIENHGTHHKPLSVDGGEAWGIRATNSPEEVFDEIMSNHKTVNDLTGKEMTLFRSGTAYYDDISVELAHALGYEVVNFIILGDAGATYTSEEVKDALLQAEAGSIALLHMNQPNSGTREGVEQAIPILKEKGFEFVHLANQNLQ